MPTHPSSGLQAASASKREFHTVTFGKIPSPRICSTTRKGSDAAVHAIIGKFIRGQAFLIELAEARFVAEERAIRDLGATDQQFFYRALQPDQDRAVFTEKRQISRLRSGATAKRKDAAVFAVRRIRRWRERVVRVRCGGIRVRPCGRKFQGFPDRWRP